MAELGVRPRSASCRTRRWKRRSNRAHDELARLKYSGRSSSSSRIPIFAALRTRTSRLGAFDHDQDMSGRASSEVRRVDG